ncbi:MAG: DNA polymerase III subunit gamma/tau [Oligoflexus sp.]|nr:DNA polymerase III subunit gamma/tau [Oligoflexus sp.]
MSYLSLARKYRPNTFADLVGQESVGLALGNAIRLKREPRGVIFTGVRGIGKTTTARIYAKALNCEKGPTPEPCNVCASCLAIQHGTHEDVLEIDGASNTGVDDVRALQETLAYVPQRSSYKIYIIDEVHMLSASAFNALLKTLEEPPEHVVFIFATTELHKVPETIQSRCQIFHLQKISTQLTKKRIADILAQENISFEDRAIQWIAREGKGSLRDALTLLDQVIAVGGGSVHWEAVEPMVNTGHAEPIYELLTMLLQKNSAGLLAVIARWDQEGLAMTILVEELVKACRNAFVLKAIQSQSTELDLLDLEEREQQALKLIGKEAQAFDLNRIFRTFVKCLDDLRNSELDRFVVENYALEWCLDPGLPDLTSLFQGQMNGGVSPSNAPTIQQATPNPVQSSISAATPAQNLANASGPAQSPAASAAPSNPPLDLRNRWKQTSSQSTGQNPSTPQASREASSIPSYSSSPMRSEATPPAASMRVEANIGVVKAVNGSPLALQNPVAPVAISTKVEVATVHPPASSAPVYPPVMPAKVASPETYMPSASVDAPKIKTENKNEIETAAIAPVADAKLEFAQTEVIVPAVDNPNSLLSKGNSFAAKMQQREKPVDRDKDKVQSNESKDASAAHTIAHSTDKAKPAQVPAPEQSPGETKAGSLPNLSANALANAGLSAYASTPAPASGTANAVPAPTATPTATASPSFMVAASGSGTGGAVPWPLTWKEFVDEWKKQKPLQARVLEETYSLEYTRERIKLAVEAESLAGQKLLHLDTRRKLLVHFEQLFGFKGVLDVIPKSELTQATDNEPAFRETLLETKQKAKALERDDLKNLLQEHPLTREAILAFDGTIEAIEVQ